MTKDQWLVVVGILLTVIFGLAALITAKIVITAKTVRKRSQRQDIKERRARNLVRTRHEN
jgi:hypothetical protein